MKYEVIRETKYEQPYTIEADSREEAERKVKAGQGASPLIERTPTVTYYAREMAEA
jgi:hypothetical protein